MARHLTQAGITHKRTSAHLPRTNGKAEPFNRTLLDEWAYAEAYQSETERRAALPRWLHTYNHHRGHTALAVQPRSQPHRTEHLLLRVMTLVTADEG